MKVVPRLGVTISKHGIPPQAPKSEEISKLGPPTNIEAMQRLLEMSRSNNNDIHIDMEILRTLLQQGLNLLKEMFTFNSFPAIVFRIRCRQENFIRTIHTI